MKILVTGAAGQLGSDAVRALQGDGESCVALSRVELDLASTGRVADVIADYAADWVINCAAYTAVDKAEEEPELAFAVNRDAARQVAVGVSRYGGRLLHVSTDFVFGGDRARPYHEDDATGPLGVYGQSKLEGECAVREVLPESVILRTAWVYGVNGHNFVKTILRLASERQELRVVDDQLGSPSYTEDIVNAIRALMRADASGTWHFTNEGVASWYDFSCEIVALGEQYGLPVVAERVLPIPTEDFPLPATRPASSIMSKKKIRGILGYDIPHWRTSLRTMIEKLAASQ